MKKTVLLVFWVLLYLFSSAQNIQWEDVSSNYELPQGVRLVHGTISGNSTFFVYYYEVDMKNPDIAVRPYLSTSVKQVHDFTKDVGAYAAINGGYFTGSSSVSAAIFPDQVLARNLTTVVRNSKTYPLIRPVFALHKDRSVATGWIYQHSYERDDIYIYDEPMSYICNDPEPKPTPLKADGMQYEDIAYGLGGGPMLVKDGKINFTYCEEIMWGSGVYTYDLRPRTVVGYTLDQKIIMLVTNSYKTEDLPQLMLDLGCHGAINLDGGGSTAMSVGDQSLYTQGRAVPTILAIVHSDSLQLLKVPVFEKTIDTGDVGVTSEGNWFESANDGYFQSRSKLHALATDDEYYDFPLNLPGPGEYEIYGWWTSHTNRAADTPFYITHGQETTKVLMNQSIGGSLWNLAGTFNFEGTPNEKVRITAAATTNQFVVADGIRVVSYDPSHRITRIVRISGVDDIKVPFGTSEAAALGLLPAKTTIEDSEGSIHEVSLSWQVTGYLPQTPDDYSATGTFELPDGLEQSDPPVMTEVTAIITVLQPDDTFVNDFPNAGISIFPNPGNGLFNLEGYLVGEHQLRIMSLDGKVLYFSQLRGVFVTQIDLTPLAGGMYLMKLTGPVANKVQKLLISK
jgi:hypothetical protein